MEKNRIKYNETIQVLKQWRRQRKDDSLYKLLAKYVNTLEFELIEEDYLLLGFFYH